MAKQKYRIVTYADGTAEIQQRKELPQVFWTEHYWCNVELYNDTRYGSKAEAEVELKKRIAHETVVSKEYFEESL